MKFSLFFPLFCLALPVRALQGFLHSSRPITELAAGGGMGMAAPSKKKRSSGKKNGMGKKAAGFKSSSSSTFDANASMMRLEKRYDELLLAAAKQMSKEDEDPRWASGESIEDMLTTEFIVAGRSLTKQGVNDWTPFAQICLVRPESEADNSDDLLQTTISAYCRELSHTAAFGATVFSSIARNDLQYSVEPVDSFQKYVYEAVVEGASEEEMPKSMAREILGLQKDESEKSIIKQAYRKLSFSLHPDRFEGSPEECEAATKRFGEVKLAYETLSSGIRQDGVSWYESLGGRARTDFKGPINLLPLAVAQEKMASQPAEAAIVGLDRELIQMFVARNLRSS